MVGHSFIIVIFVGLICALIERLNKTPEEYEEWMRKMEEDWGRDMATTILKLLVLWGAFLFAYWCGTRAA